jgi:hypothetical protein
MATPIGRGCIRVLGHGFEFDPPRIGTFVVGFGPGCRWSHGEAKVFKVSNVSHITYPTTDVEKSVDFLLNTNGLLQEAVGATSDATKLGAQ